ncbi:uncharacterized protein CDAR_192761 [Caerostris darwini]|uniref:Uncharacterized protein n=1 Tax=Caerostris darwini TaxID=1538125 RepID=A0AAV4VHZ8_9ARAC|nr:uncharacterized protein CDAR_192761 [Caerostris darwini]
MNKRFCVLSLCLWISTAFCLPAEYPFDAMSTEPNSCIQGSLWNIGQISSGNFHGFDSVSNGKSRSPTNTTVSDVEINCDSFEVSDPIYDCAFEVEEDYDEDRIPKLLPKVTCDNLSLPKNARRRQRNTQCEELSIDVPVLRKCACGKESNDYGHGWEKLNIACVRTLCPSRIRSRPAHNIRFQTPN